jgi:predicted nucleic acid-binding protein
MNGASFVDTNILVYAYDPDHKKKHPIAQRILRDAVHGDGMISTQVLGEFASVFLHKLKASPKSVATALVAFESIHTIHSDSSLFRRALGVHARYGLHFYDGLIIAAAERGGCVRVWSEDMNPGQTYFGVTVENPFL